MSFNFSNTRNIELSTLKYFDTQLGIDWSDISIVKSFKKAYSKKVTLPIVAVILDSGNHPQKEIGSTALDSSFVITFELFAESDGMRIDLAAWFINKLRQGWTYNDYSHTSGDNSQTEGVADGRISVLEFLTDARFLNPETVEVKDRYRHTISVLVNWSGR